MLKIIVQVEPFVRLDKAIFNYGFNQNLIGKQIFLKFTSFNGLERKANFR